VQVDVDLTGYENIVLNTDQADIGTFSDHLLWLDARFVKTQSAAGGKAESAR